MRKNIEILWILYFFVFIPAFIQSSHIWSTRFHIWKHADPYNISSDYGYSSNLAFHQHARSDEDLNFTENVYTAAVCPLGSFAVYGLSFLLLLYLIIYNTAGRSWWLRKGKKMSLGVTMIFSVSTFIMLEMNHQFLIRSITAIVTGLLILRLSVV